MHAVISDLLTTYSESGKGKDVILLHGWGDNHLTFNQIGKELGEKYRLISIDLPGFGATQPPAEVWGLDEYAAFVAAFIEKQKLHPYAIIAHSNGGAVALKGISRGLFNPEKLVLIASAGIRDRQKTRRFVTKIVAKTGKALTFWLPESKKRGLRKKLYGVAGSDMEVVPHLKETFKKTVRQDIQADARNITVPTLLLYGTEDRATPPLYGEIFNRLIKDSKLQVIEGAGHFIHHEKPEATAQYIRDFLYEK